MGLLTWCKPVLIIWNWSTSFLWRGRISGCTSFSWTANPTPRMCTYCWKRHGKPAIKILDVIYQLYRCVYQAAPHLVNIFKSDLLLHEVLQMGDSLHVLRVTADVFLIKEGLLQSIKQTDKDLSEHRLIISALISPLLCLAAVPPDILRCLRSQQHLWRHSGTCSAGWCCCDAVCVGTGWSKSSVPGSYSPPHIWHSQEGSPPPGNKW